MGGAGALSAGEGFADLSFWRKAEISGSDALTWLNSLVSADIGDLEPGRSRQSLLLSPTGKVRAEFTVAALGRSLLLIQDPSQPRSILELLARYMLSSDVAMADRTNELALFAFPGRAEAPQVTGATPSAPSCLGRGSDVIAPSRDREPVLRSLAKTFTLIGSEELEAWRVAAGLPRVGVDVLEDDLPQEGGLDGAVSFDKGCFLGQEAVAKVRNLGHPRRLLVRLEASDPVSPGDPIESDGAAAGRVSSAATIDGTTVVLARVRWDARGGPFHTTAGTRLRLRPSA